MLNSTLDSLRAGLSTYRERWRGAIAGNLFEVSGIYALFPEAARTAGVHFTSGWNDEWPYSRRNGVYLVLSETGRVLYIGKASRGTIGARLSEYFKCDEAKRCRIVDPIKPIDGVRPRGGWSERPAYVLTVAVPDDLSSAASALEEYLIWTLRPCDNTLGLPTT